MTPRHADVAFVLEGIPGVVEVHALDGPRESAGRLEFAVKLAHGGGHLAVAHYALLRVLSHDECETVLFFEVDLPPFLRERASRLELSVADREAARARVPETSVAVEQEPIAARWPSRNVARAGFRILIVDGDVEVYRAVVTALGVGGERVVEPNPLAAFWKARDDDFDLILCDARLAFGRTGFLSELVAANPIAARRVILLAHEGQRELLMTSLDELRCWNSFLCKPVEPDTLVEILRTGSAVQRWSIPVPRARGVAAIEVPRLGVVRRVVVVDDDPATQMLLTSAGEGPLQVVVTSDEWEAVDLIGGSDVALVLCSVSLRTLGGTPFYRFLWNARPDIKNRFAFIARPDAVPASTTEGRTAAVVERPLTHDAIVALVKRIAPS